MIHRLLQDNWLEIILIFQWNVRRFQPVEKHFMLQNKVSITYCRNDRILGIYTILSNKNDILPIPYLCHIYWGYLWFLLQLNLCN